MKKTLLFFGIVLAFLAVDFASAPLRMVHFALASIAGFISLFGLEIFVLHRNKSLRPRTILLASLLGFAILNLPGRFMPGTGASWPDFLFRLTAILLAYLFFRVRRKTGKIGICIVGCVLLAMAYPITVNWCNYLDYGTISGRSEKPISIESMPVKEMQGQTTSYRFDPQKTYVLYFWTNRCGYCHKNFPNFQQLYDRYGSLETIRFLAVNPLDAPAAENFISSQSDTPCFYTTRAFAEGLDVEGFPAVVIIRDNRTVFFGNTEMAKKFLAKNN